MQHVVEFFSSAQNIWSVMLIKRIWASNILKNYQMGCKLLKIMANGLYAIFHRFGGFPKKKVDAQAVTIGCPSNGRRASSISDLPAPAAQTSTGGTACSLLPWMVVLLPGHPSNYPHILLFSGDVSLTPQPTSQRSYSPQCGHPLLWLRQLQAIPFLGLAIIHRVGALGAEWSTWSTNNSHRKRLTVRAHTGKCLLITCKIMIPPPDS